VDNSMATGSSAWRGVLDDVPVERCGGRVRVPIDGGTHKLMLARI
jgi:hypothetical protein